MAMERRANRPRPHKAKIKSVTMAEAIVQDTIAAPGRWQDLVARPDVELPHPKLFEVAFNVKAMENPQVYRWMYENKLIPLRDKHPSDIFSVCFVSKEEAKFFRDVLNRNLGVIGHYVAYGPDHRRVLGHVS